MMMMSFDPTSRWEIRPSGETLDFVRPGMSRVVGRKRGVELLEFWRSAVLGVCISNMIASKMLKFQEKGWVSRWSTYNLGLVVADGKGVSLNAGPTPPVSLESKSFLWSGRTFLAIEGFGSSLTSDCSRVAIGAEVGGCTGSCWDESDIDTAGGMELAERRALSAWAVWVMRRAFANVECWEVLLFELPVLEVGESGGDAGEVADGVGSAADGDTVECGIAKFERLWRLWRPFDSSTPKWLAER
jgi:hypothetical protein